MQVDRWLIGLIILDNLITITIIEIDYDLNKDDFNKLAITKRNSLKIFIGEDFIPTIQ